MSDMKHSSHAVSISQALVVDWSGQVSMGWEADEAASALEQAGGDVLAAAEKLAAQEEEDLERYATLEPSPHYTIVQCVSLYKEYLIFRKKTSR